MRRRASHVLALSVLLAPGLLADDLGGQVRGSEPSTVAQTVDGTVVTVEYARPHLRGRSPIFGGTVRWGETWTPGANWATTFEFSRDVRLQDRQVPAGRYSVWLIPREEGPWELVLDPNHRLYHTQHPEPHDGQLRWDVQPASGPEVEALTFDFPLVEPGGTDLRFRWADTRIDLRVDVEPSPVPVITAEEGARYAGAYEMRFPPPPGMEEAGPEDESGPPVGDLRLELRWTGEALEGALPGPPQQPELPFRLIPVTEHVFHPAWLQDGEVFETEVDMWFEFTTEDGRVTGLDIRGLEDALMATGRRVD